MAPKIDPQTLPQIDPQATQNKNGTLFSKCTVNIRFPSGEILSFRLEQVRKGDQSTPLLARNTDELEIYNSPLWPKVWKVLPALLVRDSRQIYGRIAVTDGENWTRTICNLFFVQGQDVINFAVARIRFLTRTGGVEYRLPKQAPKFRSDFGSLLLEIFAMNDPVTLYSKPLRELATKAVKSADDLEFIKVWDELGETWHTADTSISHALGAVEDFPAHNSRSWREAINVMHFEEGYTVFRFQIYHNTSESPVNPDGAIEQRKNKRAIEAQRGGGNNAEVPDQDLTERIWQGIGRPLRPLGECAINIRVPQGKPRITLRSLSRLKDVNPQKLTDLDFGKIVELLSATWINPKDLRVRPLTLSSGDEFDISSEHDWTETIKETVLGRGHTEPEFKLIPPPVNWQSITRKKGSLPVRLHLSGRTVISYPLSQLVVQGQTYLSFDVFRQDWKGIWPSYSEERAAIGCIMASQQWLAERIPDFPANSDEQWSLAISCLLSDCSDIDYPRLEFILLRREDSDCELMTRVQMQLSDSGAIADNTHLSYPLIIVRGHQELSITLQDLGNPLDFSLLRNRFHEGWPLNGQVKYIGDYFFNQDISGDIVSFPANSDDGWKIAVHRIVNAGKRRLTFRLDNHDRKDVYSGIQPNYFSIGCVLSLRPWLTVMITYKDEQGSDRYVPIKIGYLGEPDTNGTVNMDHLLRLCNSSESLRSVITRMRIGAGDNVLATYSGPAIQNWRHIKSKGIDITSLNEFQALACELMLNNFKYMIVSLEQPGVEIKPPILPKIGSKRRKRAAVDHDGDRDDRPPKRRRPINGTTGNDVIEYDKAGEDDENEEDDEEDDDDDDEDDEDDEDNNNASGAGNDAGTAFQGLLESTDCEQYTGDTWRRCCTFFNLSRRTSSPRALVYIPGMNKPLYAFQAYAIFWMLHKQSSPSNGGFMADEQGLGKTAMFLGLLVVMKNLRDALDEVRADRRSSPKRRLHLDASTATNPQKQNAKCPSALRTDGRTCGLPCPCVDSSITANLNPGQNAPAIVFCPKNLMLNWEKEFGIWIDSNTNDMRLLILHGSRSAGQNTQNTGIINNYSTRHKTGRLIFVTTGGSYKKYVSDAKHAPLGFSHIIQDEFHLSKGVTTQMMQAIKAIATYQQKKRFLWAVSGTPFERSTDDLKGHIDILSTIGAGRSSWTDTGLVEALNIDKLSSEYGKIVRDGRQSEKYKRRQLVDSLQSILRSLMIRRTSDTIWQDQPIMDLPRVVQKTVLCHSTPAFDNYLNFYINEAENARINTPASAWSSSSHHTLRLAATVPIIPKYRQEEPSWVWTADSLKRIKRRQYHDNISEMANSSFKLSRLQTLITFHEMRKSRSDGEPEKFIIFSSFPSICQILYLLLQGTNTFDRKLKGYKRGMKRKCLLILAGTQNKTSLVRAFQGETDSLVDDQNRLSAELRNARDATILISTPKILGVGFTITRARRVILMEPAYMNRDEDQARARIRRHGQKEVCYNYKFVNRNSRAERSIRIRQRRRRNINNITFKKPDDPEELQREAQEDAELSGDENIFSEDENDDTWNLDRSSFDNDAEFNDYQEDLDAILAEFEEMRNSVDINQVAEDPNNGDHGDDEMEKQDHENQVMVGPRTERRLVRGLEADFPSEERDSISRALQSANYDVEAAGLDLASHTSPNSSITMWSAIPGRMLGEIFQATPHVINAALDKHRGRFYLAFGVLMTEPNAQRIWHATCHE